MLIRVLGEAFRTLRRAGWPALALALLYLGALALMIPLKGALLFVSLGAQNIVTFALVRFLARRRGLGPKGDGPAALLRSGEAPLSFRRPGPLGDADRRATRAMINAGYLGRSAIRLALVQLIAVLGIVTLLFAMGGSRVLPDAEPTRAQVLLFLVGLVPVAALISAFVALAPQRIAIEGDPRVILAVLQSIRIARTSYGPLFALSLVEPLLAVAAFAAGDNLAIKAVVIAVHPVLQVVVIAALNEVYDAAPGLVAATDAAKG